MSAITLDQAQRRLPESILSLTTEGDVLILGADGPVARLSPVFSSTNRTSLRQLEPRSAGAMLRPYPAPGDDLLDEIRNS